MKISSLNSNNYINKSASFKSKTAYTDNKIVQEDVLSLEQKVGLFTNPISPTQNVLGLNIIRPNSKTVELKSRYGNTTGEIKYSPNAIQPKINIQAGSFQPVIEIEDQELGIKVLLTRGSKLEGKDLNINYTNLAKTNVSFGNSLFVAQGYMPQKLKEIVDGYYLGDKKAQLPKSPYSTKLKNDYSIVALGGGYGTRLQPISDLTSDSKPSTKYPGSEKSLFEVSVLDTLTRSGINNENISFIKDNPSNLSGTAGVIIKGLNDGTIPLDKPLVLLTGDTFNNIDLANALYIYEQSNDTGIAMLVQETDKSDMLGKAPISVALDEKHLSGEIKELRDKVTESNFNEVLDSNNDKYYTATNIAIISPVILEKLKDFADSEGKAEFVEFLGLMFNTMNTPNESLKDKYLNGLKSKKLTLNNLAYSFGSPRPIYGKDHIDLKVKAIVAKDINNEKPMWSDVGTVEDFIDTVNRVKSKSSIAGLSTDFVNSIKSCTDENGLIYIDKEAKSKLNEFKQKYNITGINGNVIVHSISKSGLPEVKSTNPDLKLVQSPSDLFKLTSNEDEAQKLIKNLMSEPKDLPKKAQELIKKHGLTNFLSWYLSPQGYYGAYEKYLEKFYENSTSVDELLKYSPNWSPWKFEEKQWLIENPSYKSYSKEDRKTLLYRDSDEVLELPFTIGKLPSSFSSTKTYESLVKKLKTEEIIDSNVYLNGKYFSLKRLKGGELNNKFIYLVKEGENKYILKLDRINVEDAESIDGRKLSLFEKKAIRKEKYLAADSIYSNACMSKYLELNGCPNIPKLHYYNHATNSSLYEYIEDVNNDIFQDDQLLEDYEGLYQTNSTYKSLNELGIYLNDTALKNSLVDKNGVSKIIDLGHSNFIMPFKLGVKTYNIEFANTNGPDMCSIYAGLLF